jgi:fructokinase
MTQKIRIGIDLGGTKTEFVALATDGAILRRERIPTPAGDYAATIHMLADGVAGLESGLGVANSPVGIGIPGSPSPETGLIRNANSTWLIGKPLQRDIEAALGRPVRLANDANCFVLSEATDGVAANAHVVFGVILGTGVGGGVTVGGALLAGRNGIAGEWGHNPLPWPDGDEAPGPACWCGRHGCIETFLSGPALTAQGGAEPAVLAERASAGDAAAEAALARYENRLARALATVINLLDPDAIVLDGGLSQLARLYTSLPPLLPPFLFADRAETPILPPRHGDSSGVRGAAWLWPLEI